MNESQQILPWKARRYCSGDESWTDWRLISQAEFEHRKDDPTFEFQVATTPVQQQQTYAQALDVLKSFWQGYYWKGVTHSDREAIEAAFAALTPEPQASQSRERPLDHLRQSNPGFAEHLGQVSAVVEKWPSWKKGLHAEASAPVTGQAAEQLIHGERPTVRAFQEWLNDHRDAEVSSVFHEIVAKYRELADSSESLHAAPVCNTIPKGASQPVAEWVNQEQGFQYLVEPSLPDGALLYRAAQPTPSNDFAIKFIEKRAQDYLNGNTSSDPDDGSIIWHYGDAGREYHETLVELAEDIQSAQVSAEAPKAECEHKRMTTTALGAATNTGWKCADCGTLLSPTDAPDRAKPAEHPDTKNAERWLAFRSRDEFEDLDFTDFQDQFREDADDVIDAAIAGRKRRKT